MLVIKNTAGGAVGGNGPNGYVYGRIRRYIVTGNSYDFPVGGNPAGATVFPYELMNIGFNTVTGLTYLTVAFDNPNSLLANLAITTTPAAEPTQPSVSYTGLLDNGGINTGVGVTNIGGIWTAIPDAGTATYSMTLTGTNYDNASYV